MIAHLTGTILDILETEIILNVNNIGYSVFVGENQRQLLDTKKNKEISLAIYTLVREDDIRLYGFPNFSYRQCFAILLKVNGVGPKVAALLLDQLSPTEIAQAAMTQNIISFTQISGIGKKVGQKLILELQDKLDFLVENSQTEKLNIKEVLPQTDVLSALQNLGFTKQQAEKAISKVQTTNSDFDSLLRMCLAYLNQLK